MCCDSTITIWTIVQKKAIGRDNCVVEPGNIVSVECGTGGDGKYHTDENFTASFRARYLDATNPQITKDETKSLSIHMDYVIG